MKGKALEFLDRLLLQPIKHCNKFSREDRGQVLAWDLLMHFTKESQELRYSPWHLSTCRAIPVQSITYNLTLMSCIFNFWHYMNITALPLIRCSATEPRLLTAGLIVRNFLLMLSQELLPCKFHLLAPVLSCRATENKHGRRTGIGR